MRMYVGTCVYICACECICVHVCGHTCVRMCIRECARAIMRERLHVRAGAYILCKYEYYYIILLFVLYVVFALATKMFSFEVSLYIYTLYKGR